jgi:membrane protease YdiL (CAAX protease family)
VSGRFAGWVALVGTVSAISYAGRFTAPRPEHDVLYKYSTAVAELVTFAVIFVVVAAIARGSDVRELFGLRRPRSWRRAAGIAVGVLVAVLVLESLLNPLLHPAREQGLTPHGWKPGSAGPFAANVVVFALVGPIVEELTFRGLGYGLLRRYGQTAAVLAVGLAFGLWHGLVEALPILVALGVGLTYLRARTESLYPPIVLHATFNAAALALAVAS